MTIAELKPESVWRNFYALTRIPRPSGHEAAVADYLCSFGKNLGLETIKDETGNIIIRKPAIPGMENLRGVILQGHMDMVPQKNADKEHDFVKDPIETRIDGEWVKACGTTLGADNGIGVAMALAVLEADDIEHGPVEVLVTVDEETGMTGARGLKPGVLKGDILINLDSETEGELYIGCAGGMDATGSIPYRTLPAPAGYITLGINVKGLKGGHSGMDIILCRANANKVAARVLLPLLRDCGVKLAGFSGGNMRNAIPREAFAAVLVPEAAAGEVKAVIARTEAVIKKEYAVADPDIRVFAEEIPAVNEYISEEDALKGIYAVLACPDGTERMSDQMPGLVETSNNLAIVSTENGEFHVNSLLRSSVDSAKEMLAERIAAVFALAGGKVVFDGEYSGWAPNSASPILHTMKNVYAGLYGREPAVMAIHAGLECGIFGGAYPDWDMVSCGPTIMSPHSPDERVNIASVGKCWDFLKAVLAAVPRKA